MRARLTGAFAAVALAVLAALATPSLAQDPGGTPTASPTPSPTASPSPTPSPTPTPEQQARAERDARDRSAKAVRRIYRDFEDGRIDDCDHPVTALKRARRSIEDSYGEEFPDFRDALTAAIERHDSGKCQEQEQQLQDRNSDPTPTPTAAPSPRSTSPSPGGSSPAPAPAPAPAAPSPPSTSPDSGSLPDFGAGSGGSGPGTGGSSGKLDPLPAPPGEDAIPEGTPSPTPTPAPAATPALPPKLIVTRAAASPNMFVPGTLLAIALAGLLIAALSALAGKRSGRLAGVGHAWREAAWRTSGTWSDFTDWLRSNR
jgi:hypothetical protein